MKINLQLECGHTLRGQSGWHETSLMRKGQWMNCPQCARISRVSGCEPSRFDVYIDGPYAIEYDFDSDTFTALLRLGRRVECQTWSEARRAIQELRARQEI